MCTCSLDFNSHLPSNFMPSDRSLAPYPSTTFFSCTAFVTTTTTINRSVHLNQLFNTKPVSSHIVTSL